jgi:hypothetical protein
LGKGEGGFATSAGEINESGRDPSGLKGNADGPPGLAGNIGETNCGPPGLAGNIGEAVGIPAGLTGNAGEANGGPPGLAGNVEGGN